MINSPSLLRKSSQKFRQTANIFKFLDDENFRSNFMKMSYFDKIDPSFLRKSSQQFPQTENKLRFLHPAKPFIKLYENSLFC